MPITNAFDRIDGDNIAYDALVDKRLYFGIHVGITQNMAYDNMLAALFLRVEHAAAVGLVGCNRLFKQKMIPLLQRSHRMSHMLRILCADKRNICHLFLSKHLFAGIKTLFQRHTSVGIVTNLKIAVAPKTPAITDHSKCTTFSENRRNTNSTVVSKYKILLPAATWRTRIKIRKKLSANDPSKNS